MHYKAIGTILKVRLGDCQALSLPRCVTLSLFPLWAPAFTSGKMQTNVNYSGSLCSALTVLSLRCSIHFGALRKMSSKTGHFRASPSKAQSLCPPTPNRGVSTGILLPSPACTDLHLPGQGQLQQLAEVLAQSAQGLSHTGLHRLQDMLVLYLEAPGKRNHRVNHWKGKVVISDH